jgi:hypothetical protein
MEFGNYRIFDKGGAAVMRRLIGIIITVVTALAFSGCVRPFRVDGPYSGRIIDAETSKPIEGVVVDATWYRVYPNVAGSSSKYYDTRETLTDKNGDFDIPGMGILLFSTIDKPIITIFKAGYDEVGPTPWQAFDLKNIWQFGGRITNREGQLKVKLRHLSMDERKRRYLDSPSVDAPNKKMKLFIKESNREMIEIGNSEETLIPVE